MADDCGVLDRFDRGARARPFFANTRPGERVEVGGTPVELPILYTRDDCFALYFSADARRVRELLPSDRLRAVTLPNGRAALVVIAFNYLETTIGRYGEVGVIVPVVFDRRPVPLLPLLLESSYPGFGALVLHLPVTETLARDGGRTLWGYTKFVAEMAFERTPERQRCRVAEGGQHVLTLDVPRRGSLRRDVRPLVTYSVLDGALIKTTIPQRSVSRLGFSPRDGRLELGDHPVGRAIAALDPSPRPLLSRDFIERAAILPRGEIVEHGVRSLEGYRTAPTSARLADAHAS